MNGKAEAVALERKLWQYGAKRWFALRSFMMSPNGCLTPVLRKAQARDIPDVAAVFIASQADALPFVAKLHTVEETFEFIAENVFVNCEVWVATDQAKIIGMMAINHSHIDHLYLTPGFYRRGIGTLLLNHAKEMRPEGLTLYAFEANERACAFYQHHGFVVIERGDGSGNEAGEPDVLFEWKPEPSQR